MQNQNAYSSSLTNGQETPPAAVEKVFSGAADEVNNLLSDGEDLLKSMTSLTGADLARARANLEAKLASAKESAKRIGGVISDRARDSAQKADGYVHAQPWQAVGIGAAIGLVVGIVIARR